MGAEKSDVLELGQRILKEYEQIETAFFAAGNDRAGYAQLAVRLDDIHQLLDKFAVLLKENPDPDKAVQEIQYRVAACYRGFTSLYDACKNRSTAQDEAWEMSWEDGEKESFEEELPEDLPDDALLEEELPEEEWVEDGAEKKNKKSGQSSEKKRQEGRRMAASSIHGYQANPEQQYSESDIQTAELRRREEIRRREQQETENRRIRQESIDAYRRSQQQARDFERPTGHIDMSFRGKQSAREPENPSHQEQQSEKSTEAAPSDSRRKDAYQEVRQEIAAALGVSITAVQSMSSSELRFWQNRLKNASAFSGYSADATGKTSAEKTSTQNSSEAPPKQAPSFGQVGKGFHPPDARSSEAEKRWYEKRVETAAKLGIPLEKVLEMTDHEFQEARYKNAHQSQKAHTGQGRRRERTAGAETSSGSQQKSDGKAAYAQSEQTDPGSGPKRYTMRKVMDVLVIGGKVVGAATFELGKTAAYYGVQRMLHDASSENDAVAGIMTGSYYLGTAGGLARAALHHNPTAPIGRSASGVIGKDFPDRLHQEAVKQQFGRFKRQKDLDGKMLDMLRNEKGKLPRSANALRETTRQVEKDIHAELAKKVGSGNLERSRHSLKVEISSLKQQGAAMKERLKLLESKRGLSAKERQEILYLRKNLKFTGKRAGKLVSTLRAKEDLAYVSQRLQGVAKRAAQNKQAVNSAAGILRNFMLRPLAEGRESNTEGLYYGYRIISHPYTRRAVKAPVQLARLIAPEATQALENAAHAAAAAPKELAIRVVKGIKRGVYNAMPSGVKTGIQRAKSAYAVAKTGIQNTVFRAKAWTANTWLGHAKTATQMAGRWVASGVRSVGLFAKAVVARAAMALGLLLAVASVLGAFLVNIMGGSAGSVIMSPAESTSGKINLGPYCMVYSSESRRFDENIAALIRKYSDKEVYDSVETNYSGVSSNARQILSMMAIHLNQNLDIDKNPDVKNYISYMFRQSHIYSVYENRYYCEGCERRPVSNVPGSHTGSHVVGGTTPPTEPEMEDYCPGHIDVTINIKVYDFDEIFGLDQYPASGDWAGWTTENRDWCKTIYEMDWNELYEGLEYLSSGAITGVPISAHEQKIWDFLLGLIGNEYGAAGMMGNLYCESGLDPTNLQDSYEVKLGYNNATYTAAVDAGSYSENSFVHDSAGYGLAQWTWHARKQALYRYCIGRGLSIGSIDGQLGYLGTELEGSFAGCLSNLQGAGSVAEASRIAMLQFEAPADQSASAQAVRQQYAEYFYNKMVFGVPSEGNLTQKQQEVIHIAMNSASYGIAARPGYCQAWAAHVYGKAGLPIDNSASAYDSGVRYGVSSDFSIVPPGAAVYGYSGSKYGHVGIYVGNGQVYHNVGGVAVDSLSDWISKYKGFCWGWEGGSDLTTYE